MKAIHVFSGILLSLILFCSCEKEIAFKGVITDPLIVVNSFITPDSIVSAHISKSEFFLNNNYSTYQSIPNADISVLVNGLFKEKMNYVEKGIYSGTYKPLIGDVIKLIVKVPTNDEVVSETKILTQPTINSIDTTDVKTPEQISITSRGSTINGIRTVYYDTAKIHIRTINYTLKFNDDLNIKNYYRLIVNTKNIFTVTDKTTGFKRDSIVNTYNFNFTDVVSGNNSIDDPLSFGGNSSGSYAAFTDELFNGKTYSLTFSTNEYIIHYITNYPYAEKVPDRKEVYIYLQSISKDYYLYLKSRMASKSSDPFFSEQIQIHNNIVGGIGIFGSYTSSQPFIFRIK